MFLSTGNEQCPVCLVESHVNVLPRLPEAGPGPARPDAGGGAVSARRSFELAEACRKDHRYSIMTYSDVPCEVVRGGKGRPVRAGLSVLQMVWDHDVAPPPPEGRLINSISAAVAMARRVSAAYQVNNSHMAAKAALNSLDLGCLVFDRSGRLVFSNPTGRTLVPRNTATGKDMPLDAPDFQRELRGFFADRSRPVARLSRSVSFRLPSGEVRPAYLMRLSLAPDAPGAAQSQWVALFAPTHRAMPTDTALQIAFGLTPAEARVAARIACGTSIARTADELSLSVETARSYSKTIFSKLGISRQSALAAHAAWLMIPTECGLEMEGADGAVAPRPAGAKPG